MVETPPFDELYERALDGDRDALAELYIEQGSHMRRRIAIQLQRLNIAWAIDPDDVFDSFFTRIIEGRVQRRFTSPLHFVNYCEAAVRNKCQQMLRSVILRTARNIADCPPELLEDHNAADQLDRFSWDECLEEAYSRLTHLERVVCFYRLGDHSWEEISLRLGKSPAALRMIHYRAAKRIDSEILAGGWVEAASPSDRMSSRE